MQRHTLVKGCGKAAAASEEKSGSTKPSTPGTRSPASIKSLPHSTEQTQTPKRAATHDLSPLHSATELWQGQWVERELQLLFFCLCFIQVFRRPQTTPNQSNLSLLLDFYTLAVFFFSSYSLFFSKHLQTGFAQLKPFSVYPSHVHSQLRAEIIR